LLFLSYFPFFSLFSLEKCKQHKIFMLSNIKQTLSSSVFNFFFSFFLLCVFSLQFFFAGMKRKTIHNFPIYFSCLKFQLNKFHNNNSSHQKRLVSGASGEQKKKKKKEKLWQSQTFHWMNSLFFASIVMNTQSHFQWKLNLFVLACTGNLCAFTTKRFEKKEVMKKKKSRKVCCTSVSVAASTF
jgi:hypothetical protein